MNFSAPDQLTLDVKLHAYNTFDNFVESKKNEQLLNQLRSELFENNIFLWGRFSPGRTHLLHAALQHAKEAGRAAVYIPLRDSGSLTPNLLKNIDKFDLAIDWGFLYFITKPLFYAISYFYQLFGNFGVAIIILTVITRIVFYK